MKFQVKTDETELIGIDLKSVSLKRQIKNDAQTEVISLMNLNQLRNFNIAPVEESVRHIATDIIASSRFVKNVRTIF